MTTDAILVLMNEQENILLTNTRADGGFQIPKSRVVADHDEKHIADVVLARNGLKLVDDSYRNVMHLNSTLNLELHGQDIYMMQVANTSLTQVAPVTLKWLSYREHYNLDRVDTDLIRKLRANYIFTGKRSIFS